MKKIIVSTFLLASLVACYKDDVILEEIQQEPLSKAKEYLSGDERVKMKRHKITPERAMLIAEDAKELFADENRIKTRSVSVALLPVAITSHPKTRSAGGTDTLMYVVNYSNGNGFVFVSNDDRDGEILMYSGGGNFTMQDTAGNEGLKMHVEMMLAYQEHKLKEMRAAESNGEVYMGGMTTEEIGIDECLPNIMASTKGVVPGLPGGLPGHTCNVTGQPGMPGAAVTRKDICAPATYVSKDWQGHTDAVDLAQNKYRNQKCFGVPVLPPDVKFTTQGAPGIEGSHQNCFPYCSPHIGDYKGYYENYGAKMSMHLRTTTTESILVQPLSTTCWDQGEPLLLNNGKNFAGCGPIAMAQIMLYHNMPKTYGSKAFGGVHSTYIDELRKLRTNTDIAYSPYKKDTWKFIAEIAARLNVTYNSDSTTSTSYMYKFKSIRETFESFGYSIGYDGIWDYTRVQNFNRVLTSLRDKQPVFIAGYKNGSGHIWVLDGYKQYITRLYYADYYFDEYGNFNSEKKYTEINYSNEFVHANLGWGKTWFDHSSSWVLKGVYDFGGTNYNNYLYYIAGIIPRT